MWKNNEEEACNTGLQLGLGLYGATQTKKDDENHDDHENMMMIKQKPFSFCFDLGFDLCPKEDQASNWSSLKPSNINMDHEEKGNCTGTKKVKHDFVDDDDDDDDNNNNRNKHGGRRKKLKLTKDQSNFLEDYFKSNTTLDPAKKQALADKLNLKPRQVSVWFQNRRARTKLKQTEEDYQLLKKCCESLSQENRRLKKELQELRSLRVEPSKHFCIQFANSTSNIARLMTCSSCKKISQESQAERDDYKSEKQLFNN